MFATWLTPFAASAKVLLTFVVALVVLVVIVAKSYLNICKVAKGLFNKLHVHVYSTSTEKADNITCGEADGQREHDVSAAVADISPKHDGTDCRNRLASKDIHFVNKYQPVVTSSGLDHRIVKETSDDEEFFEKKMDCCTHTESFSLTSSTNDLQCNDPTAIPVLPLKLNLLAEEHPIDDTDVENCSDNGEFDGDGEYDVQLLKDGCGFQETDENLEKPAVEHTYGSVDIELEDQVYSLKTESCHEFVESQDLPDDLVDLIADTCVDESVDSPVLYQCDRDPHKLLLTGIGAEDAQQAIQDKLEKYYDNFIIYAQNIRNVTDGMAELSDVSNTFLVKKYDLEEGSYTKQSTATCELILRGMFINTCKPYEGYLAVVPAHFVLTKEECRWLKVSQGNNDLIKEMEKNVAKRMVASRFDLSLFNSMKQVDLRLKPPMLAYRHCSQDEDMDKGVKHYTAYMNDTILFELETREPVDGRSVPDIITSRDIERAMRRRDKAELDVIFPLKDPKVLATMGRKRVCVKVGPTEGHMIMSGINLTERGTHKVKKTKGPSLLHHIRLVVNSPLHNGHSGTIIYVIDKDSGRLYRFGMLVAELEMLFHPSGKYVYQGVVLRQAIDEIESKYAHVIRNLRPVGQHDCQHISGHELVNDLLMRGAEGRPLNRTHTISTSSDEDQNLNFNMDVDDDGTASARPSLLAVGAKASRMKESHGVKPAMAQKARPPPQCPCYGRPGLDNASCPVVRTPLPKSVQHLSGKPAAGQHQQYHKGGSFTAADSGLFSSLETTDDAPTQRDVEETTLRAQGAQGVQLGDSNEAFGNVRLSSVISSERSRGSQEASAVSAASNDSLQ